MDTLTSALEQAQETTIETFILKILRLLNLKKNDIVIFQTVNCIPVLYTLHWLRINRLLMCKEDEK